MAIDSSIHRPHQNFSWSENSKIGPTDTCIKTTKRAKQKHPHIGITKCECELASQKSCWSSFWSSNNFEVSGYFKFLEPEIQTNTVPRHSDNDCNRKQFGIGKDETSETRAAMPSYDAVGRPCHARDLCRFTTCAAALLARMDSGLSFPVEAIVLYYAATRRHRHPSLVFSKQYPQESP